MPAGPGPGSLFHWTQFPHDGRPDLEQDSALESGAALSSLQAPLVRSLQHCSGESSQQASVKRSVKKGASCEEEEPAGSCDEEAGILSNMVLRPESMWARWDCQDEANNSGFVCRACISSAQRFLLLSGSP